MKKVIFLSFSLFTISLIFSTISAQSDRNTYEKWCFANFKDEELKECLENYNTFPESRAGCIFCDD